MALRGRFNYSSAFKFIFFLKVMYKWDVVQTTEEWPITQCIFCGKAYRNGHNLFLLLKMFRIVKLKEQLMWVIDRSCINRYCYNSLSKSWSVLEQHNLTKLWEFHTSISDLYLFEIRGGIFCGMMVGPNGCSTLYGNMSGYRVSIKPNQPADTLGLLCSILHFWLIVLRPESYVSTSRAEPQEPMREISGVATDKRQWTF